MIFNQYSVKIDIDEFSWPLRDIDLHCILELSACHA